MKAGGLQGLAKSFSLPPVAAIARLISGMRYFMSWAMLKLSSFESPSCTYV